MTATSVSSADYPARLTIDYPDRELDRVSTLLRGVYIIPIAVVLGLIGASFLSGGGADAGTVGAQSVHLQLDYPDVPRELNRWLPLAKWFLAIPHFIALLFLGTAAAVTVVIAWFAVVITGRYPRGIFDFVEGVLRWALRVDAYAFLLITDRYPPFSLA
jgi:hypothetical protein